MAYGAAQVDFTYQQEFWICLSVFVSVNVFCVCVCVHERAYPQDCDVQYWSIFSGFLKDTV